MLDIPAALVIGSICGILGSLFIYVNVRLAVIRKKYIKTNLVKLFEAIMFAIVTALVFYMVAFARRSDCVAKPTTYLDRTFRFFCPEG